MSTGQTEIHEAPHDAGNNGNAPPLNTVEGALASKTGNHLVMTNLDGKKFSLTLAKDAKLTCDGAACQTEELKTGRRIRVTTRREDRNVAISIDTVDKHAEFTQC